MAMELLLDATTSSGSDRNEHHLVLHPEEWTKRKRSIRHRSEEDYLALCLLMLARSGSRVVQAPPPQPTCATIPTEFKCSVCGKCFGSYQALGGHKTSHRVKPVVTDEPATSSARLPVAAGSVALSRDQGSRVHKCSICLREFATGQALGGHKRRHYEGVVVMAAAENSEVASSENQGFDLNLPAVPEFAGFDVARTCVVPKWEEEEEVQSPLAFKKPRLLIQA